MKNRQWARYELPDIDGKNNKIKHRLQHTCSEVLWSLWERSATDAHYHSVPSVLQYTGNAADVSGLARPAPHSRNSPSIWKPDPSKHHPYASHISISWEQVVNAEPQALPPKPSESKSVVIEKSQT